MRDVGTTLAMLRKEKGLVQKELAALLNLSVSAVSSYEKSVHAPDLAMLGRLAEFYGVTTDYLLGRTEYRCPPESLSRYISMDYTVQDMVNTVLSLDSATQASIVNFVKYMKHLHSKSKSKT
ncbi:MAG: helix-turn-helix transcriptional regulator [Lachnospiraceae bacterium]|nr:helix-turn-helix transcriptional regulator [uncultured Acetatifactor sp.]MCI9571071.1 helix-turn-helix transcriptional regulator [Lachnospiraceae bacterium]